MLQRMCFFPTGRSNFTGAAKLYRQRRFLASPGQTSAWWDNSVGQKRTVSGPLANILPGLALRGSKNGANELYIAGDIAWGMHIEQ